FKSSPLQASRPDTKDRDTHVAHSQMSTFGTFPKNDAAVGTGVPLSEQETSKKIKSNCSSGKHEQENTSDPGNMKDTKFVDKYWRVTIVAASALCLSSASLRSAGYIYASLIEDYGLSRSVASWPDSLTAASFEMSGLIFGQLWERTSLLSVMVIGSIFAWLGVMASGLSANIVWLSFTLGIIHGIGAGFVVVGLHIHLSEHFDKYRGTAHGIMYAGSSLASVFFPEMLLYFKEIFGFRNSLSLLGVVLTSLTFIVFLLAKPPTSSENVEEGPPGRIVFTIHSATQTETPTDGEKSVDNLLMRESKVFSCPMYYVILATCVAFNYSVDVFQGTVNDYATDKGRSLGESVSIVSIISTTDILGGVFLPMLVDRKYVRRSVMLTVNYFLLAVALALLPLADSMNDFLVACLFISAFMGCGTTMYGVLQADYVSQNSLPFSYGVMGVLTGLLFVAKPFLVGFFRDYTGSYDGLFRLLGGCLFGLSFLWLLVVVWEWKSSGSWHRKRNKTSLKDLLSATTGTKQPRILKLNKAGESAA
ncbi:unnamed protein product, partial [Ixodes persulcatus]